jgi:hypothetical protein
MLRGDILDETVQVAQCRLESLNSTAPFVADTNGLCANIIVLRREIIGSRPTRRTIRMNRKSQLGPMSMLPNGFENENQGCRSPYNPDAVGSTCCYQRGSDVRMECMAPVPLSFQVDSGESGGANSPAFLFQIKHPCCVSEIYG